MATMETNNEKNGDVMQEALRFGLDKGKVQINKLLGDIEFLHHPADKAVTFWNVWDKPVSVKTYDSDDAVRWVSYENRTVASGQVVQLEARESSVRKDKPIHVYVKENDCTYDMKFGTAYAFDGSHVHPAKDTPPAMV